MVRCATSYFFFFLPLLSYRNLDIEVKCSFSFFFFFILSLIQWSLVGRNGRICNTLLAPLFLVSATITEIAMRCTTKIVHIIWTTISHFDVCWPLTAAWFPVKTHPPADLTVCYYGVSTIQPGGCSSATSCIRWTWSWHSCAGWPLKTKPARCDSIVTITVVSSVGNLSVTAVKTCVILTFWYRKNKIIVIIRINLTFKKLENYLIF